MKNLFRIKIKRFVKNVKNSKIRIEMFADPCLDIPPFNRRTKPKENLYKTHYI